MTEHKFSIYQCAKRMHMEMAMKHVPEIQPIRLPAGSVHRLDGAKGQQITCLGGVAWVTQANDTRDIILSKGQSFIIDRKGLAVIYASKRQPSSSALPGTSRRPSSTR